MIEDRLNSDVYYRNSYGKLYEAMERGEYIKYEYASPIGTVTHPFIKRLVPYLIDGKKYYDIVTPYGYGGPLITYLSDDSEACKKKLMQEFLDSFSCYCHDNNIIAEFIRFHPLYENALSVVALTEKCKDGYNVIYNRHTVAVDLRDLDFFSTQFDPKCRNMVRKAEKLGVSTEIDSELATIDTFADIYYETMAKDSADDYYFFNRDYFREMRDELKGESLIVNALYEGNTVASSLFLYTPGSYAHYHLSATSPPFYKLAANNLILKAACEELQKHSCTWLHLGGGLSSDPDDKLLAFKRSFGRLDVNRKDFYIGKKVWDETVYERVEVEHLNAGGKRNLFFPEYRG